MAKFSSRIFIDGGEPAETREAVKMLGYLDGQTTNPSLIAENLASNTPGGKLSLTQAVDEYRRIVNEISSILPDGSVSIQVLVPREAMADEILTQARDRKNWIPNGSIKIPCTFEGLRAASIACTEMPINITLVFSQSQAAAVYEATKNAKFPVFVSPFVGRLDDINENGMDVVANILQMYKVGDGHVKVLTASVRNIEHIKRALQLGSNIITIPFKVFSEWADKDFPGPSLTYSYQVKRLKPVPYKTDVYLGRPWEEYDLHHDLTEKGILKFNADWSAVVSS